MMLTNAPDASTVRRLLEDLDLRIVLDSPADDYRFEYFTTSFKDRSTGEALLTRTYRLIDLIRGGITPEPWDSYDLDKHTTLVTNLLGIGRYRIAKVVSGWQAKCPTCGHILRGKNWEPTPRMCTAEIPKKCREKIGDDCIVELRPAEA